ncbi:hypothetical protein BKK51_07285 [Rodentibacter trehalosifermentans]|uniref:DUF551 domain-containing protein n=1 Tax=Rodentibacter trehalosifermentans TaxID=1908263 RepID=A0A1V3ISC3_9PAST|nr:DUF551 domain-containing protein [Rodentibacter trehalosifermentans]OOF45157.1 hypothetical protein BKK51_07285 [Rodentibacter trehalosifermentans]OOF48916.1 hypothetical protein BKK52_04945 [Rodentibacter trehalosifermentans]
MTKENNGWISVDDRLPDDGKEGLILNSFVHLGSFHDGIWYKPFGGFNFAEIQNVTHWQPIPEPPKKD